MFVRNLLVSSALCLVGAAFAQTSVGTPMGGSGVPIGSNGAPIGSYGHPVSSGSATPGSVYWPGAPGSHSVEPPYDQRNEWERNRIREGVASGSLTRAEAERLRAQQWHIHRVEQRDARNGVSPQEQARLTQMQNRASHDIRWQKHDAQGR